MVRAAQVHRLHMAGGARRPAGTAVVTGLLGAAALLCGCTRAEPSSAQELCASLRQVAAAADLVPAPESSSPAAALRRRSYDLGEDVESAREILARRTDAAAGEAALAGALIAAGDAATAALRPGTVSSYGAPLTQLRRQGVMTLRGLDCTD